MQECNGCTLCCKLLNVPGLASDGVQCKHANEGCTIYQSRSIICRTFDCFWRAESWPEELKPSKCHVLFEALPKATTILVTMDKEFPEAWRQDIILNTIAKLVKKGRPIVVRNPEGVTVFFLPEHITQKQVMKDISRTLEGFNGSTELYN